MTHIPFGFMRSRVLWTPDQITTLGWWDASDTASITESGGAVSNVAEQKGGVDFIQNTGSLQPVTGIRSQNGLNVLDFDGTEQLQMSGNGSFAIAQPTNVSFISVHAVDVVNNNSDGLWCTTSANNDYALESNINSEFRGNVSMSNNPNLQLTPIQANDGPSIYGLRFSRTDSTTSAFIDGDPRGVVAMNNNLGPNHMIRLMVSRGTARVDGWWGEMVVLNDDTTTTRQLIEGYLAWKWGLQGNLPGGHPYKNFAPTV